MAHPSHLVVPRGRARALSAPGQPPTASPSPRLMPHRNKAASGLSIRPWPVRRRGSRKRGGAMRYMLMICADESGVGALSPEEGSAMLAEYGAFGGEMGRRGVLQTGERLRPTTDATTVQVRDGKVLTADGPFAETKEQGGGYYLVDCNDLDEAIQLAAGIPGAKHGSIEVRPIWEM